MSNELIKITQPVEIQARKYIDEISKQNVLTRIDFDHATEWLKPVIKVKKDFEAVQKEKIKPLKDQVDEIKAMFKRPLELLEEAENIVRKKCNDFLIIERKEQERILAEEQKQKQIEAEKELKKLDREEKKVGKFDEATGNALKASIAERREDVLNEATRVEAINQSSTNASVRMVWDFEIESIENIPSEFLILDEKKVREAIRAGTREIKGLKIYQKPQVAIK